MSKLIDLTGQRFGRLTVVERAGSDSRGISTWLCQCDCNNKIVVRGDQLRSQHTQSCGCRAIDIRKAHFRTHNKSTTRLYRIWGGIKRRCFNPKATGYDRYGGRGITVCDEWLYDFQAFYDWAVANGYQDDLSIDRIDVNGNYCPENCRWATQKEQNNNLSTNRLVTIGGETKTMSEWCRIRGIHKNTAKWRLDAGWSPEKTFEIE